MALPFITANWKNIIVVNYEVTPEVLLPFLPAGTELDQFEGKTLVSLVAFHFQKNKLFGYIPTYPAVHFEEINLRFYVRRRVGEEIRRGVVFIKEVVPSAAIAITARTFYNEPYETRPMFRSTSNFDQSDGGTLSYGVRIGLTPTEIAATTRGPLQNLSEGSIEQFILEHYWGYTPQEDGTTSEYRVEHSAWRYWDVSSSTVDTELLSLYPEPIRPFLQKAPISVCVAEGAPVAVYTYKKICPIVDMKSAPQENVRGWILYDGACGFCSWWVPKLRTRFVSYGFGIAPLQSAWVQETLKLPPEKLTSDIRLLLKDGTLISGADAYIFGLKTVWWARPLGIIFGLPVLRWITWKCYKLFNSNRFIISRICRLPPELP